MSVVIQSDLNAFKASLPPHECVLAEWFLRSINKGWKSHTPGSVYLVICTESSLYACKLHQKKIASWKRYNLLDLTNIQVGYLTNSADDALDELEVNPGHYAIRFYFNPKEYKTFKYPSNDVPDDTQKAFIQVIYSSLKASRRELYHNSPTLPLAIPSSHPSPVKQKMGKQSPKESPSPKPSPTLPPSPSPKQETFMMTVDAYYLDSYDEHEPVEGVITITQRHFVFEPSVFESPVLTRSRNMPRSPHLDLDGGGARPPLFSLDVDEAQALTEPLTVPLSSVAEAVLLREDDDDVSLANKQFARAQSARLLKLFAEGKKLIYSIPAKQAETTKTKLVQWIQAIQDKIAKELMARTAIVHPLLTQDDNTTQFKGDSDILSIMDVLYLQYKMPDRHAMDRWELVYSTMRHGISINTFYTNVTHRSPTIIVIEDSNHHIFGGYASEPWEKGAQSHYGSGESFLFKIKPISKVFKWSKLNDYFMYSSKDFISMGGGGNGSGLWVDSEFDHGSTAVCDTFLNEPLSIDEQFRVLRMEVWSVPVFFKKKVPRPDI